MKITEYASSLIHRHEARLACERARESASSASVTPSTPSTPSTPIETPLAASVPMTEDELLANLTPEEIDRFNNCGINLKEIQ